MAAAAATSRLLVEIRPSQVLFVGSCGAYDSRWQIGDLVAVREVRALSLEELSGAAYRPQAEQTTWIADWMPPFPACTVAVPPAITRTEAGAARFAPHAAVENLELSGVFEACRRADIPVAAALVVTNHVGPQAHEAWKAHHVEGGHRLIETLKALGMLG